MSHRQAIVVPDYASFRDRVLQFVRTWTRCGEIVILADARHTADEWARAACEHALIGVHRLTLAQLALTIAEPSLAREGVTPVTHVVAEAIASRVTALALDAGRLQYFYPVARTPGFASALASTLAELRLDSISPEYLAQAGGPGADLAYLLALYDGELKTRLLVDRAGQFAAAIAAARRGPHALRGVPLLLLDTPLESVLERELLDAVAEHAPALLELRRGQDASEASTCLQSMQRYLFADAVPRREPDSTVDIFAASGEALECIEMARRIGAAARQGTGFDRMAILLRAPERYQSLVEEALRRAGIPGHFTRGNRLPFATGRAFLALLECAREGLSATRFAEYLSLGQAPRNGDEAPAAEPAQWERLLLDAGVVGGVDRWRRRLGGLAAELNARYAEATCDAARETAEREATRLAALADFALPVIEQLAALPRAATWGEWLDALRDLAAATLHTPEVVLELCDELQPMAGIGPVDLDTVLAALEAPLRALRGPHEASRYGRVWVGSIDDARGMSFDLVFLPGLNEGSFPRPPSEDPLLLDAWRERIPGARRRAREDNELLSIAAAAASSRIVLSYSRLDLLTGRQRVPSFYIFEALRAARGEAADVRDIEREAERGAVTRIGWPAPADWQAALDDAEFDLAVLRPAFDDPLAGKGAGAYLTRVNQCLVRSLRARGRRWRKSWHAEDGLVAQDVHTLQLLDQYKLRARAYSPSLLEQYAACPYRFALRAVHQLYPLEGGSRIERMNPALRGQLFHRVQFELLRHLRETGAALADAGELLDATLDRVAAEFAELHAPAIPHIWAAECESLRADLRGWLQQAGGETTWTPAYFELGFGLAPDAAHDEASVAEPVAVLDGFLLSGSIDLVERNASGLLRVVDHKTGAMPKDAPEFVGGGAVLQPLLYALAAENLLARPVISGRVSYATLRHNYRTIEVPVNDFTRERVGQVLRIIDGALHNGFLPAAPREDACRYCDYVSVCGPYEEERVARKSPSELKPLRDLRRMS